MEIRDEVGQMHYTQTVQTLAVDSLSYELKYITADRACLSFNGSELPVYALDIYLNGEMLETKLEAGIEELPETDPEGWRIELIVSGLVAGETNNVRIRDPQTGALRLFEDFVAPYINVADFRKEYIETRIDAYYQIMNPKGEAYSTQLLLDGVVVDSKSYTQSGEIVTFFEDCQAYTEYTVRIVQDRDGVVIYQENIKTLSFFWDMEGLFMTEIAPDGREILLMERVYSDGIYINYSLIDILQETSMSLECVSEDGFTLPVENIGLTEDFNQVNLLYNEYAFTGVIYELRLYDSTDPAARKLLETRYLRIADDQPVLERPEFALSVQKDGTLLNLTITHTGGTLLEDGNEGATYQIGIVQAATEELTFIESTQDFKELSSQSFSTDVSEPGLYRVELYFGDLSNNGGATTQAYCIFSREITV